MGDKDWKAKCLKALDERDEMHRQWVNRAGEAADLRLAAERLRDERDALRAENERLRKAAMQAVKITSLRNVAAMNRLNMIGRELKAALNPEPSTPSRKERLTALGEEHDSRCKFWRGAESTKGKS